MKIAGLFIVTAALAFPLAAFGQDKSPPKPRVTQGFMRLKLNYSQGALEGLVTERFGLVITNGLFLRNMSSSNTFLVLGNREYLEDIVNFQDKVNEMIKGAVEKDLKWTTTAYSSMVESCVHCHKRFRLEQLRKGGSTPK